MQLVKKYNKSKLFKVGKLNIVQLNGNYEEMGMAYGDLQKEILEEFYNKIIELFTKNHNVGYDFLKEYAYNMYDKFPKKYKIFFESISKTSTLNLQQLLIISVFECFLYDPKVIAEFNGCSSIATWGEYTKNKEMIVGRNYDMGFDVGEFKKFLNVVIFKPNTYENASLIITFAGTICATTNFNDKGLFVNLNNGGLSEGGGWREDVLYTPAMLLDAMLNCSTLADIENYLKTVNTGVSAIINVADFKQAYAYEWGMNSFGKNNGNKDGLLASTNHFVLQRKDYKPSDVYFLTMTRRNNLLDLAEKNKGKIDVEILKNILNMQIDNGGVTQYEFVQDMPYTTFQVIMLPETQKLWLKIPNLQDWELIDLNKIDFLKK